MRTSGRLVAVAVVPLSWLAVGLASCSHSSASASDGGTFDAAAADGPSTGSFDSGVDAFDAGCAVFDASDLDEAMVIAGEGLASALKCAHCHGQELAGDPEGIKSPLTEGGLAYPPNLTNEPTTGLGCWTNEQIVDAILYGVDDEGQPICPPMPEFAKDGVDASGALDIALYLRSLHPTVMNVPPMPGCSFPPDAGLDAGGGSDGAAEGGGDASDAGTVGDGSAGGD
ncbi:MAG TPA: c-type cytochrome [Polyangiaceae bacterium]